MNRNFFVRLAFATHRVADTLPQEEQIAREIKETASTVLADLILLTDKEVVIIEKKRDLFLQLERQIDILLVYLGRAKKEGWVNPENFSLLEDEYGRIRDFFEIFEDIQSTVKIEREKPKPVRQEEERQVFREELRQRNVRGKSDRFPEERSEVENQSVLTERQKRIIEFLKTKENAQVWQLQRVLPEVTKRTLRRDLDELLEKNLVERKGEWNSVSYELK